ncbi:hypothetical protein HD597_003499 [Nonomuraea thailandensis]|uniref:Uncharacterized protein n=1 Tax=Nonomuraea thailandensis TaxID=1188745 RepID=A0A9X2GFF8_9ACTN|nr:hypothetical protein [Nonomuraea thailandensis]MCP2356479.1 hypothetical protein [Nonomuraea thailandensis]
MIRFVAAALTPAGLPAVNRFDPVEGNWGGLPPFQGALDGTKKLLLFSGADYHVFEPGDAVRPFEYAGLPHDIVRLTSSTAYKLNREPLVGGVAALLAPATQESDELPGFSTTLSDATTIKVWPRIAEAGVPVGSHLDFQSANGVYYWELFFHAPMLIARALNGAQRFEEARTWYEYVFDPTRPSRHWRFLPFLAVDVRALAEGCRRDLAELAAAGVRIGTLEKALLPVLAEIEAMAPAFQQIRELTGAEETRLGELADGGLAAVEKAVGALKSAPPAVLAGLRERLALIGRLRWRHGLLGDRGSLLRAYLDDPFDPHAIAELRPAAYRRAVVMAYVDNLLDWGDLLFRQYTGESVDEARMLRTWTATGAAWRSPGRCRSWRWTRRPCWPCASRAGAGSR